MTGVVIWLLLVLPVWALAGNIQYATATGFVESVSDAYIREVPGFAVITIAEPVADIQWPLPVGCPAGSGQPQWTHIDNPAAVTVSGGGMSVRPDSAFFGTTSPILPGCHQVPTWRDLKRLYEATIVATMAEEDLVTAIS